MLQCWLTRKGIFCWSHWCQTSLLIVGFHVDSSVYVHKAFKLGFPFSPLLLCFWLVTVGLIPEPTCVLHSNYRGQSCLLYRCESIQAVWITDRTVITSKETTFWHLGEEWQHAVGLWRDIVLANEDTVKIHAYTLINKIVDNLNNTSIYTREKDLTGDKIAGSRQHFHTSPSSSSHVRPSIAMTGPNGRVVWRTGEREAVNVCVR